MTSTPHNQPLIAIVGPTASGKSDLGIALAQRFNGEVINCDSVQVYRGLYVATAKVPPAEQQGIPHHLIDLVEPTANFTAVAWAAQARAVSADIEARGKTAWLVGGTGFYLRALTTQFFAAPEIDERLRPRLLKLLDRQGPEHLHRLLQRVDPPLAARFAPKDWSRVTRALEVYFSSGQPLSYWQAQTPEAPTAFATRLHYFVLQPPREVLYDRINRRVDLMVANGLLAEIERLVAAGVPLDAKAFQAHGYKRFVEYLQGARTLASAIEQMKLDTRHYAKRQWTWWRAQSNTIWLPGFGFEPEIIAEAERQAAQLLKAS
ncbi:MAG: tRNA (adenosine(37)-N6)-dimethylallyltransferase MiaA [Acidobacteria bacterium]|nr:tRNA (adenosine(37)-N6)-dimethylallyltransferase MiaA [Acidobacteriota bacterium]MBI3422734.1 tRNA (adenosine(37)-N6)-dimethylallyltransferase MiaA [Acidobacteriota bacterium]